MPELARQLSSTGADLAAFAWLPLLIWTLLAVVVLAILYFYKNIHVQYHYHARLALIFALPAGLLLAGLVDLAAGWLSASSETAVPMKFIVVQAPVEITAGNPESTSLLLSPAFWYGTGMVILLIGTFLFFFRHLHQYIQLNRLTRQLTLTPLLTMTDVTSRNKDLVRNCGKPVFVAYLEKAVIPVTYGVRKPVVLLPVELKNDTEKMNLVLRHELVHVLNRDYLVHLLMTCIRTLFWFHPVVHLLYHQLIEYRELRCDSLVLSDDSISRKKYASVLLELLPMPNLNKNVSVNMAQESSNIKKRITMMQTNTVRSIPFKASFSLFCSVILAVVLIMSCTDMQQHTVFDEEELDLMTNIDRTGERGYHEIVIFLSDEDQVDRHDGSIRQIEALQPEHIESVNVLKGESAVEKYGTRGEQGVIEIRTRQDIDSYNRALRALGMEPVDPSELPAPGQARDNDFFVVVEQMPELIGGLASLQSTIQYPEMARRAGIEGRVYVQFIVNEVGDVEEARVIRGIGGGADEEALQAVNQAKFRPGMQRGQPVRVQYSLPIVFRLPESSEESGGRSQIDLEAPEAVYNQMQIQDFQRSGDMVRGKVIDANTEQPIAGANIIFTGTNIGSVTDLDGTFTLNNVTADAPDLLISFIGYESVRIEL